MSTVDTLLFFIYLPYLPNLDLSDPHKANTGYMHTQKKKKGVL